MFLMNTNFIMVCKKIVVVNQFKTIEIPLSKQFSTIDRFGLDLFNFFSKHNEIVSKNSEYERTKDKTLGDPS